MSAADRVDRAQMLEAIHQARLVLSGLLVSNGLGSGQVGVPGSGGEAEHYLVDEPVRLIPEDLRGDVEETFAECLSLDPSFHVEFEHFGQRVRQWKYLDGMLEHAAMKTLTWAYVRDYGPHVEIALSEAERLLSEPEPKPHSPGNPTLRLKSYRPVSTVRIPIRQREARES